MKNNRRQFIKKSFLAGVLGCFAPGLINFNNNKYYYDFDYCKFRDYYGYKYATFGNNNTEDILNFYITNYKYKIISLKNGIYKSVKLKNFHQKINNSKISIEFEIA